MLMSLPLVAFSQKQYYLKTFDDTFSSDALGWYGDPFSDFTITLDTANGILDVVVKKEDPWSVFDKYMGNCWANSLVLDQSNRYMEFRVKSVGAAVTKPITVYPKWGRNDGCPAENKTYPSMSFTIPVADEWKIVFLTIPQSTGGSQNVIDTLTWWFAFELPNGTFQFDYIKLGNAAIPPTPTIDVVKDKNVLENAGPQMVTLTGISLPGRDFIDGLDITAEAKTEGIITDVTILDLGNGKIDYDEGTKTGTATLSFTPVNGMNGLSDSIIITLRDTIRGKMVRTGFKVTLLKAQALSDADDNVKVYPTEVSDVVNIELAEAVTGEVSVVDVVGNVVASQKLVAASTAKVDLSKAAAGMYLVKIAKGSEVVVRKVVKK